MEKFSRKQILILTAISLCQFCVSLSVSIQAPFYPGEAASKGVFPSEYGFVFAIHQLTMFLASPLYGKYLNSLGIKLVYSFGVLTVSLACLCFGFLDKVDDKTTFLGLSLFFRIIEGNGQAAFNTAAFAIVAMEFPNSVASIFAIVEIFFGLGLIAGPALGGVLFELGGFICPFSVIGSLLLISFVLVLLLLPALYKYDTNEKISAAMILSVLKTPHCLLTYATVFSSSIGVGFLLPVLEPHLRQLNLRPLLVGLIFIISAGWYMISSPILGLICDKFVSPRKICSLGCFLVSLSFLLIGPAPFFKFGLTISLCVIALSLHGIGAAAELVASFLVNSQEVQEVIPGINVKGLAVGLWGSFSALGYVIGQTAGGILFDVYGFRNCSMIISNLHMLLFLITLAYICFKKQPENNVPRDESN